MFYITKSITKCPSYMKKKVKRVCFLKTTAASKFTSRIFINEINGTYFHKNVFKSLRTNGLLVFLNMNERTLSIYYMLNISQSLINVTRKRGIEPIY